MMITIETRWFGQGQTPAEILTWYDSLEGDSEQQSRRRDHYLGLTGEDALGVKIREGALEVKRRQRSYGLVRLDCRVLGLVEGWTKWRFALKDPETDSPYDEYAAGEWLVVDKERQLRRYQLTSDRVVCLSPGHMPLDAGCTLELSKVRIGGDSWWTLAFEAFGESPDPYEQLQAITKHLFRLAEPPLLAAADSYGYPRWLMTARNDQ